MIFILSPEFWGEDFIYLTMRRDHFMRSIISVRKYSLRIHKRRSTNDQRRMKK